MKKIILSLSIALSSYCSYGQTDVSADTTAIGLGATSTNWAYKFTYQNHSIGHYGLGWYNDLDFNGGPTAYLGGYGGIKFFTGGNPRLDINNNGNVGIGTTFPGSLLQVNGITSIRTNTTTDGYISINPGSPTYQGYINWWKPGGTRVAYMGYTDGSTANNLALTLEASANFIVNGGNVLIGKTSEQPGANYKLDIGGRARANEIVVNTTGADFVFDKQYVLPKLSDVKAYVDKNQHLPEIPSAKEMQTNGMSVGEINTKLLQKVEELTLYLIQQKEASDKQNKAQQEQIDQLKQQLTQITKTLNKK